MFSKRNFISFVALLSLTSLILACGSTETVEVVKEVEVIKEVEVEKVAIYCVLFSFLHNSVY